MEREYTDVKNVKHSVEHLTLPIDDKVAKEQIIEALLLALTRPNRRVSV